MNGIESTKSPIHTASVELESNDGGVEDIHSSAEVTSELPFLVTHYLLNYGSKGTAASTASLDRGNGNGSHSALERIRRAATELAAAFEDFGAYGTTCSDPIGLHHNEHSRNSNNNTTPSSHTRNTTYSELTRKWSSLPPNQLQSLVQSSQSATHASYSALQQRQKPLSVIHLAYERKGHLVSDTNGAFASATGTHPATAIDVDSIQSNTHHSLGNDVPTGISLLHKPTLLTNPIATSTSTSTYPPTSHNPSTNTNTTSPPTPPSVTSTTHPQTPHTTTTLAIASDHNRIYTLAAQSFRRYLHTKAKHTNEQRETRELKRSLTLHQQIAQNASDHVDRILATQTASASCPPTFRHNHNVPAMDTAETDRWLASKRESERVSAQLTRKLNQIADRNTHRDLITARTIANTVATHVTDVTTRYSDPSSPFLTPDKLFHTASTAKSTSPLSFLLNRPYRGGIPQLGRPTPSTTATTSRTLSRLSGSILSSRISHAATICCHLFYPVYCLRFDRTGQYFVTGADDQLVKVFRLGRFTDSGHIQGRRRMRRQTEDGYGDADGTMGDEDREEHGTEEEMCYNGAVLVCTLRGHAAVITDIDVSADNALLATASDDGDVRIWGMENGCPVAILRGHKGGANMVSWSVMTPFRLVTAADDGLARMWDIREAALKRCAAVRSRVDYTLPNLENDTDNQGKGTNSGTANDGKADLLGDQDVALPPLPDIINEERESTSTNINRSSESVAPFRLGAGDTIENPREENDIVQPQGEEAAGGRNNMRQELAALNQNSNQPAPGAFVAGDQIDEGVRLLHSLAHFDVNAKKDQSVVSKTRSRRKDIRVVCLSRCPVGGHFATGSTDGMGRIWLDEDDEAMGLLDKARREQDPYIGEKGIEMNIPLASQNSSNYKVTGLSDNTAAVPPAPRLLSCLRGHTNCITDVEYSNVGDRLLTASQRDGVVRVWSWGSESSLTPDTKTKQDLRQIVIRLTSPRHCNNSKPSLGKARRATKGAEKPIPIYCDLAIWTRDDLRIVTSQSCPLKESETETEIIPGSHMLHVWDSHTGLCLIGLPAAHDSSCPVLISHPLDSNILASAGLDGYLKVWNLDEGDCIFSHRNELQYGAMESTNDKGKICGYLDGNFSPDGLSLVLTDKVGRITLVDVFQLENTSSSVIAPHLSSAKTSLPEWMKEQFFASDYYDLFYDASGYCIEVGSQQPPHLAPLAARCDHGGVPYTDNIQTSFRKIRGPASSSERDVWLGRDIVRQKSYEVRKEGGTLSQNVYRKAAVIHGYGAMASFIEKIADTGIVLSNSQASDGVVRPVGRSLISSQARRRTGAGINTRSINDTIPPSSNYRWIDFDDMIREDEWRNPGSDEEEEEYYEAPRHNEDVIELSDINGSDTLSSPRRQPQHRRTPATTSRSSRSPLSSRSSRRHRLSAPQNVGRRLNTSGTGSRRNIRRNPLHDDTDEEDSDDADDSQQNVGRRLNPLGRRSRRPTRRYPLLEDTDEEDGDDENEFMLEDVDNLEEEIRELATTTRPSRSPRRRPGRPRNLGRRQRSSGTRPGRSSRNDNSRNLHEDTDDDADADGNDNDETEEEEDMNEVEMEELSEDEIVEEELTTRTRSTRVSSRQQRVASQRTVPYEDKGSSEGSEAEQCLSNETRPSGEYVNDYTILDHIFKLPSFGRLNRDWVDRQECLQGWRGTKLYAPQVGDSIVYIARAHYDTLKKLDMDLPWKSWPTTNAWPVVRCMVKSIRYRFPYKEYYARGARNHILNVSSVVSILTLEITGVSDSTTDRDFPWPSPKFVEDEATALHAIKFDISIFTSQVTDFIIPEALYLWRLRSLENSWLARETDEAVVHVRKYVKQPARKPHDAPKTPSNAEVRSISITTRKRQFDSQGSGYKSLSLSYDGTSCNASPWEVDVIAALDKKPLPSCLTTEQIEAMQIILDEIDTDEWVLFSKPVDCTLYVDYPRMIEIPMYLSKIRSRLASHFYTNISSVAADMKLIRDNCMKYNGKSDILTIADEMLQRFEELLQEQMKHISSKPGVRDFTSDDNGENDENDDKNNSTKRNAGQETDQGQNAKNIDDELTIPWNPHETKQSETRQSPSDFENVKKANDSNIRKWKMMARTSRATMMRDSMESEVSENAAHSPDNCNVEEKLPSKPVLSKKVSRASLQSPDGLCKIGTSPTLRDTTINEDVEANNGMSSDSSQNKARRNTRSRLVYSPSQQSRMRLRTRSFSSKRSQNDNSGNELSDDDSKSLDYESSLCIRGKSRISPVGTDDASINSSINDEIKINSVRKNNRRNKMRTRTRRCSISNANEDEHAQYDESKQFTGEGSSQENEDSNSDVSEEYMSSNSDSSASACSVEREDRDNSPKKYCKPSQQKIKTLINRPKRAASRRKTEVIDEGIDDYSSSDHQAESNTASSESQTTSLPTKRSLRINLTRGTIKSDEITRKKTKSLYNSSNMDSPAALKESKEESSPPNQGGRRSLRHNRCADNYTRMDLPAALTVLKEENPSRRRSLRQRKLASPKSNESTDSFTRMDSPAALKTSKEESLSPKLGGRRSSRQNRCTDSYNRMDSPATSMVSKEESPSTKQGGRRSSRQRRPKIIENADSFTRIDSPTTLKVSKEESLSPKLGCRRSLRQRKLASPKTIENADSVTPIDSPAALKVSKKESASPKQGGRRSSRQRMSASPKITEESSNNYEENAFICKGNEDTSQSKPYKDLNSNNLTAIKDEKTKSIQSDLSSLPNTRSSPRKSSMVGTYCDISGSDLSDDLSHDESETPIKAMRRKRPSPKQASRRSLRHNKIVSPKIIEESTTHHCNKKVIQNGNSLLSEEGLPAPRSRESSARRSLHQELKPNNSDVVDEEEMKTQNNDSSSLPKTRSSQRKQNIVVRYCESDVSDYDFQDDEPTTPQNTKRQKQNNCRLTPNIRRAPKISKQSPGKSAIKKETRSRSPKSKNKRPLTETKDTSRDHVVAKKQKLSRTKGDSFKLPVVRDWPSNTVKQQEIRELALCILELVKQLDTNKYFYSPVVESFPDLKDTYLKTISTPMDFRTIKEERIDSYRVISDLQQDLILIFSNCCVFNKKGSEIWNYTFSLWNKLNSVFIQALKDKNITLPRRFEETSMI